jgi:hypothetical protein
MPRTNQATASSRSWLIPIISRIAATSADSGRLTGALSHTAVAVSSRSGMIRSVTVHSRVITRPTWSAGVGANHTVASAAQ